MRRVSNASSGDPGEVPAEEINAHLGNPGFSRFEIVALGPAVVVNRQLIEDGQSNWLEGLMLVAVYLMLGVGFFFLPPGQAPLQ
jgi:hypothetical protein